MKYLSNIACTLHTFLIGLFSILSIYAYNIYYLEPEQLLLPIAFVTATSCILLYTLNFIYKAPSKSALFLSVFWLLFFCYGAIHFFVLEHFKHSAIAHHRFLVTAVFLLLIIWAIILRSLRIGQNIIRITNFFALVLVLLPVFNIIIYHAREATIDYPQNVMAEHLGAEASPNTTNLPDIVYLILDGYGREDQLLKNYGFDNSAFTDSLEHLEFQVASKSRSNYCRTAVSVASSLNLNYIQNMVGYNEGQSYKTIDKLSEESVLIHFLKSYNYNLFSFKAGFNVADLSKHATMLTKDEATLDEFIYMVYDQTPFSIIANNPFLSKHYNTFSSFVSNVAGLKNKRIADLHNRTLYPLDSIPQYVGRPAPSFVFANVYVGHPPFLFNEEGKFTPPKSYEASRDGNTFMSKSENREGLYTEGLIGQTTYLNSKVLRLVKQLQLSTVRPTVIILQGDHGPGKLYHQTDVTKTDLHDRFSILNAVYMPKSYVTSFPEDLTPVNTWRYILNAVFKTHLPVLPNRQFYSGVDTPCEFIEVTEKLASTPHKTPALPVYSHSSGAHTE